MTSTATTTAWDSMTDLEKDTIAFSDMHKDAFGFRPRGSSVDAFLALDGEARIARLGALAAEVSRQLAEEAEAEAEAAEAEENAKPFGDWWADRLGL